MNNFCLASITYISLDSTPDKDQLTFRDLDSAIRVDKVKFEFENLVR